MFAKKDNAFEEIEGHLVCFFFLTQLGSLHFLLLGGGSTAFG